MHPLKVVLLAVVTVESTEFSELHMHLGDLCAMDVRCTNPRILGTIVGNNK